MSFLEDAKKAVQEGLDLAKKNLGGVVYAATGNEVQVPVGQPPPANQPKNDFLTTIKTGAQIPMYVVLGLILVVVYFLFFRKK